MDASSSLEDAVKKGRGKGSRKVESDIFSKASEDGCASMSDFVMKRNAQLSGYWAPRKSIVRVVLSHQQKDILDTVSLFF